MNKAFVREPDDAGQRHCPRCGSLGTLVAEQTLAVQLPTDGESRIARPAYFCPFPACEIVYFDLFERVVTSAEFGRPVYPKDLDAPMCGCFGVTRDDLEADLEEGGVARVRQLIERSRGPQANCLERAVSGQCCVAEVQRYFLKRRGERGGG